MTCGQLSRCQPAGLAEGVGGGVLQPCASQSWDPCTCFWGGSPPSPASSTPFSGRSAPNRFLEAQAPVVSGPFLPEGQRLGLLILPLCGFPGGPCLEEAGEQGAAAPPGHEGARLLSPGGPAWPAAEAREPGALPRSAARGRLAVMPVPISPRQRAKVSPKCPVQFNAPAAAAAGEQTPVSAPLWTHLSLQVSKRLCPAPRPSPIQGKLLMFSLFNFLLLLGQEQWLPSSWHN